MKKLFFTVVFTLIAISAMAQSMPFETDVSAIFSKNTVLIGEPAINLQDLGLGGQSILKSFSILSVINNKFRIKYTNILPFSQSGNGTLTQQITLNGITYGPKDADDKEHQAISIQYNFSDQKIQIDFLPLTTFENGQMYLTSAIGLRKAEVAFKGIPNGNGKETSKDLVETVLRTNRTLLGIGLGGYQKWENMLFKYKITYDFLNQSRGWTADLDLRYEINKRGFVGIGYYYQDLSTPLGDTSMRSKIQGGKAMVGLLF